MRAGTKKHQWKPQLDHHHSLHYLLPFPSLKDHSINIRSDHLLLLLLPFLSAALFTTKAAGELRCSLSQTPFTTFLYRQQPSTSSATPSVFNNTNTTDISSPPASQVTATALRSHSIYLHSITTAGLSRAPRERRDDSHLLSPTVNHHRSFFCFTSVSYSPSPTISFTTISHHHLFSTTKNHRCSNISEQLERS